MAQKTELRRGKRVRVARQDADKAKLALYGYDRHEHFGEDGVVTDVRETDSGKWFVVRFDDYGREAVPYTPEELEPL
jgi:hypothetical protein